MRLNLRNTWKNFNATLLLLALFAIWIRPARAQSQDRQQDIQQLKDKLQQLEQTMGEVKAEINRLEVAPPSPSPAPVQSPAKTQKTPAEPQPLVAIPAEGIIPERPNADPVPLEGEITER